MTDPDYLVCGFQGHVPGSKEITCTRCGRAIFVAPVGQKQLIGNPALVPICLICAAPEMRLPDTQIVPPDAFQMAELRQLGLSHEQIRDLIRGVTGHDIGEEDL